MLTYQFSSLVAFICRFSTKLFLHIFISPYTSLLSSCTSARLIYVIHMMYVRSYLIHIRSYMYICDGLRNGIHRLLYNVIIVITKEQVASYIATHTNSYYNNINSAVFFHQFHNLYGPLTLKRQKFFILLEM